MLEWGLLRISVETNGTSEYSKIPFNSPLAAFVIASLILSGVASLSVTNVRSINETFGVGTLIAVPSNLPLNSEALNSLL